MHKLGIDIGAATVQLTLYNEDKLAKSLSFAIEGRILNTIYSKLQQLLPSQETIKIGVTGVGKSLLGDLLKGVEVNDIIALKRIVNEMYPQVRTIIDLGGEFSKLIILDDNQRLKEFSTNGFCAAGAGAFLEQQAKRLQLDVHKLSELASKAEKGASIAGRCSVFAKSDMIHLQQKGIPVDEIAYGLCQAMMRTFDSSVVKGTHLVQQVLLAGGGVLNKGLVRAFKAQFPGNKVVIPAKPHLLSAKGCALEASSKALSTDKLLELIKAGMNNHKKRKKSFYRVLEVKAEEKFNAEEISIDKNGKYFLGIDVGSVSTNFVVLDKQKNVVYKDYQATKGRPIEVVQSGIRRIGRKLGHDLIIGGCGVTGSGRKLAASISGADIIRNEITAQMTSTAYYFPEVDTIFEIGGQDSKFISLKDGRLSDFLMNKICAAGTGSFLEEQSQRLAVNIINEFSEKAVLSESPVKLGNQCTVFMDSAVVDALRDGESVENICAGLAYSVASNYLERVVGRKNIGKNIVFQGGTASNGAVVAAFENILNRKIKVHPHNRVSGAIGVAILALEKAGKKSNFLGFEANEKVEVKAFECKACANRCQVSKITAHGKVSYFGDTCEKYSAMNNEKLKIDFKPIKVRKDLIKHTVVKVKKQIQPKDEIIGIISGSISREFLPLWTGLIKRMGYKYKLVDNTDDDSFKKGKNLIPEEVCMPLKIAAGQVAYLLETEKVDRVFLPSVREFSPLRNRGIQTKKHIRNLPDSELSHSCIFTQQLPVMLKREYGTDRIIAPILNIERQNGGLIQSVESLAKVFPLPFKSIKNAFIDAFIEYEKYSNKKIEIGEKLSESSSKRNIVIIGKPYNIYDTNLNMGLINHLQKLGETVIPMDFLDIGKIRLGEVHSRVPWRFGRDQLKAAKIVKENPKLYPLIISNFGCGPDSFLFKHLEEVLAEKPQLYLEFDELKGEAGMVTRLEAFIDELNEHENRIGIPNQREIKRQKSVEVVQDLENAKIKRLFIPHFGPHTKIYSALFKSIDEFQVIDLPEPDEESIMLGEKVTDNKECHPYSIIGGDMLKVINNYQLAKGDTFFILRTITPCLLTQYGDGFRAYLRKHNLPLQIADFNASELWDVWGFEKLKLLMEGLAVVDSMVSLRYRYRPYFKEVEDLFNNTMEKIEKDLINLKSPFNEFEKMISKLTGIVSGKAYRRRPIVGFTGDLYTRLVDSSNFHLLDKLEEMGCEIAHSPYMMGGIDYSGYDDALNWARRGQTFPMMWEVLGTMAINSVKARLKKIVEDRFAKTCLEPEYEEMRELASAYVGEDSNYLVSTLVGKYVDFARKGTDGVISVAGLNCMVGVASGAAMKSIRENYNNIPMIYLSYGGDEGVIHQLKLETFVNQVFEYQQQKHSSRIFSENIAAIY
ncbi:MAG: acyl-CoA dehydratase activase [Myxococcota bacterium]